MRLLIKNGFVTDGIGIHTGIRDIYIEGVVIKQIGENLSYQADRVIDAEGLYVFPGFVDAHCHLRDPGYEYKEDIKSGTLSAAYGGFTSVACMPNTNPVADNKAVITYIIDKAKKEGVVHVYPIGAITKGQKGEVLADIGEMKEAGAVAISDDGVPVASASLMRKAIEKLHTNKTFYTELSNRFSNIPILMENESCFAAYAEHTIARSGREGDNILIDINEGVGCGIIIDDNIYKGAWGIAGELGHMTIDMNGEHCECGNRGCLETLVSIPAILKRALKAAEEKKSGVFWELVQKKDLPLFDSFLKAYEDKDPVALETVLHAADCLAFGINNAVNLLDIRQIGISGRITKFGKLFIDRVKQKVKSMSFDLYGDKIQVNYSVLGDDTVVLGGARYLLDNIYRPKRDFANQGI
jgi:predicted NBD/HSP70 family sugar kinase